jgi:hypothetical protein
LWSSVSECSNDEREARKMKAKCEIAVLAGVLIASVPALAMDLVPFTGSFSPPGTPPYTVVDSGYGTATVTADNVYGKGAGYTSEDDDDAYLLVQSNGIGQPAATRTTVVTFTADTTNFKNVRVSGYWMPALAATLPGDSEYFYESNDCVTIQLEHDGSGPSPVILVNNECGGGGSPSDGSAGFLNLNNGSWLQFASALGDIPDDATTVSLVVYLTSSAVNESLGLDNLEITGLEVQAPAPAFSSIGLAFLALGMLAIGYRRVVRRARLASEV